MTKKGMFVILAAFVICILGIKPAGCESHAEITFDKKTKVLLDRYYDQELMALTPDELNIYLRDRVESTKQPKWFVRLGEFYNRQGQYSKAMDVYTQAAQLKPGSDEMRFFIIRQDIIVSQDFKADIFKEIEKFQAKQQITLLKLLAQKCLYSEQYDIADQAAKRWAKLEPENPRPLVVQARIMVYNDQLPKALQFLQTACEKNPDNLKYWRSYALFCKCFGENKKAWDAWQELLKRTTPIREKLKVIRQLTLLSGRLKNTDKLIDQISKSLNTKDQDVFAMLALAEINGIIGKYQMQEKYLSQAAAKYSKDVLVLCQLASFQESLGDYLQGIETLNKAWNIGRDYKVGVKLGWQYFDIGKFKQAWNIFEQVFAGKTLPVETTADTIATLIIAGEPGQAVKLADLSVKNNPDDYIIGYVRAIALEESNQTTLAANAFLKLLNIKTDPQYIKDKCPAGLEAYLRLSVHYPPCIQNIMLLDFYGSSAYSYREKDGIYTYTPIAMTLNNIISLPYSRLQLRYYVLVHLNELLAKNKKLNNKEIIEKLQASNIKNAGIMLELAGTVDQDYTIAQETFAKLWKKYPNNKTLELMRVMIGENSEKASLQQLESIYEEYRESYPLFVLQILLGQAYCQFSMEKSVSSQDTEINKIVNWIFDLKNANSNSSQEQSFSQAIIRIVTANSKSFDAANKIKAEEFLNSFAHKTQSLENTPEKEYRLYELINMLISMGRFSQANKLVADYAQITFKEKQPRWIKKTEEIYCPLWNITFPPHMCVSENNIPLNVVNSYLISNKAVCVKLLETAQNRLLRISLLFKLNNNKAIEKIADEILNDKSAGVMEIIYAGTFFDKIGKEDQAISLLQRAAAKTKDTALNIQLKVMMLQICMGNQHNKQFHDLATSIIDELANVKLDVCNMENLLACARQFNMSKIQAELSDKIKVAKQKKQPEYPWATYDPSYTVREIRKDIYRDPEKILNKAVEYYLVSTQPERNNEEYIHSIMFFVSEYNLKDKFLQAIKPSDTCNNIGTLRRFAIACIQLERFELAKQYCQKILKINNKDTFAVSALAGIDVLNEPLDVSKTTAPMSKRQKLTLLSKALSKDNLPKDSSSTLTMQVGWYKLVAGLLNEVEPPLPVELKNQISNMILNPSSVPLYRQVYVDPIFAPGDKLPETNEEAARARAYLDSYKSLLQAATKFPTLQATVFNGRVLIRNTDKISDEELFSLGMKALRSSCKLKQDQSNYNYYIKEPVDAVLLFALTYAAEHNKNKEISQLISELDNVRTSTFYGKFKWAFERFNCSNSKLMQYIQKSIEKPSTNDSLLPTLWLARKSKPSLTKLMIQMVDNEKLNTLNNDDQWFAVFVKSSQPEDIKDFLDALWKKTGPAVVEMSKRKRSNFSEDKTATNAAVFNAVFHELCYATPLSKEEIENDNVAEEPEKTAISRQFKIDRILTDFLQKHPIARTRLDDSLINTLYFRYYKLAHRLPDNFLTLPILGDFKTFRCYNLSVKLNTLKLARRYIDFYYYKTDFSVSSDSEIKNNFGVKLLVLLQGIDNKTVAPELLTFLEKNMTQLETLNQESIEVILKETARYYTAESSEYQEEYPRFKQLIDTLGKKIAKKEFDKFQNIQVTIDNYNSTYPEYAYEAICYINDLDPSLTEAAIKLATDRLYKARNRYEPDSINSRTKKRDANDGVFYIPGTLRQTLRKRLNPERSPYGGVQKKNLPDISGPIPDVKFDDPNITLKYYLQMLEPVKTGDIYFSRRTKIWTRIISISDLTWSAELKKEGTVFCKDIEKQLKRGDSPGIKIILLGKLYLRMGEKEKAYNVLMKTGNGVAMRFLSSYCPFLDDPAKYKALAKAFVAQPYISARCIYPTLLPPRKNIDAFIEEIPGDFMKYYAKICFATYKPGSDDGKKRPNKWLDELAEEFENIKFPNNEKGQQIFKMCFQALPYKYKKEYEKRQAENATHKRNLPEVLEANSEAVAIWFMKLYDKGQIDEADELIEKLNKYYLKNKNIPEKIEKINWAYYKIFIDLGFKVSTGKGFGIYKLDPKGFTSSLNKLLPLYKKVLIYGSQTTNVINNESTNSNFDFAKMVLMIDILKNGPKGKYGWYNKIINDDFFLKTEFSGTDVTNGLILISMLPKSEQLKKTEWFYTFCNGNYLSDYFDRKTKSINSNWRFIAAGRSAYQQKYPEAQKVFSEVLLDHCIKKMRKDPGNKNNISLITDICENNQNNFPPDVMIPIAEELMALTKDKPEKTKNVYYVIEKIMHGEPSRGKTERKIYNKDKLLGLAKELYKRGYYRKTCSVSGFLSKWAKFDKGEVSPKVREEATKLYEKTVETIDKLKEEGEKVN